MKKILLSTKPDWCEKIANRIKPIEVRKTAPQEVPFKALIYCTNDRNKILDSDGHGEYFISENRFQEKEHYYNGKIIGEFICDEIIKFWCEKGIYLPTGKLKSDTCLTNAQLYKYGKGEVLYGWHISDLKLYDEPKDLSEFNRPCPIVGQDCEKCLTYAKPYTWEFDEKSGKIFCTRVMTRPPQSWCYVEENIDK